MFLLLFSYIKSNSISYWPGALDMLMQVRNNGVASGGLHPCPFLQKSKKCPSSLRKLKLFLVVLYKRSAYFFVSKSEKVRFQDIFFLESA